MIKIFCLTLVLVTIFSQENSQLFLGVANEPGFIQFDEQGDQFFYWLFPAVNNPSTAPLVVWLTGGPGSASEIAVFYENGPFKINENLTLTKNPYSWNLNANMLYIDQPVGTGYSTGIDLVTNEDQIATDFFEFLTRFYNKHTQFNGRSLYIVGESYAGHYIPEIVNRLYMAEDPAINIKGMAIGNGLVNAYYQYPAYATFAYQNGIIDKTKYDKLVVGFKECQKLIKSHPDLSIATCELLFQDITGLPYKFNVYDYKLKCQELPLCYNFSLIGDFLKQTNVITALGVAKEASHWKEQNAEVFALLLVDWMTDISPKVVQLLNYNLSVLIYSGELDFICNWIGGYDWSANMNWKYANEWNQSNWQNWTVNSLPAGQYKHYDSFTFLKVYNAGHMVPMDQPVNALSMFNDFIQGGILEQIAQK